MRWRKLVVAATLGFISAAACATTSITGLYCAAPSASPERPRCEILVETPEGVWVADDEGARLADRDGLTLRAPARPNDPWQLDMGEVFFRGTDPVLDQMLSKLQGRHIFYGLNSTGEIDRRSMLVMDDAIFIHTERHYEFPWECLAGILVYSPAGLRDPDPLPTPTLPPVRRTGFIERQSDILTLEHMPGDCPKTLDPAGYNSARNPDAFVEVFLRGDGSIKGVNLVDRRIGRRSNGGFYVPADISRSDSHALIKGLGLFLPSRGL